MSEQLKRVGGIRWQWRLEGVWTWPHGDGCELNVEGETDHVGALAGKSA